jgi:hypothetical protein
VDTIDLCNAPDWYVEAKECERNEAHERAAKTKEDGEKAALDFSQTLRSFLPAGIEVVPHWDVRHFDQSYQGSTQAVYAWAEVRLTDDVTVVVTDGPGGRCRVAVPGVLKERELVLSPTAAVLQQLARLVDDVHKARAQQAEIEQRDAASREENERLLAQADAKGEARRALRQRGVDRALELGLEAEWVSWPYGDESEDEYLARVEAVIQEPVERRRREEVEERLRDVQAVVNELRAIWNDMFEEAVKNPRDGDPFSRLGRLITRIEGEPELPDRSLRVVARGHVLERELIEFNRAPDDPERRRCLTVYQNELMDPTRYILMVEDPTRYIPMVEAKEGGEA